MVQISASVLLAVLVGVVATFVIYVGLTICFAREAFHWLWRGMTKPLGVVLLIGVAILTMAAATQINLTNQVAGILPSGNGGTGTASTLTGLVRGGSAYTAAELSGDVTTSGSNATTVVSTHITGGTNTDLAVFNSTGNIVPYGGASTCTGANVVQTITAAGGVTCLATLVGTFADNEVPTGTINGANTTFTLAHTPSPALSLNCFLNGVQQRAAGADFTLATATLTYGTAPLTGATLVCNYRY